MTHYRKGYSLERNVKLHLESQGYYVIRSAGSHGIADLMAKKPDELCYFIQLKSGTKITKYEKKRIEDFFKLHKFCSVIIITKIKKQFIIENFCGKWKQNIYKHIKEIVLV